MPFLDIAIKRNNAFGEISVYRKPTHSYRYVHYDSAYPHYTKKELVRGQILRAQRLLKGFPEAFRREIKLLRRTFTDEKNGYPPFVFDRWLRQCKQDLERRPGLATVASRLKIDQFFGEQGNQKFVRPAAETRSEKGACDFDWQGN